MFLECRTENGSTVEWSSDREDEEQTSCRSERAKSEYIVFTRVYSSNKTTIKTIFKFRDAFHYGRNPFAKASTKQWDYCGRVLMCRP